MYARSIAASRADPLFQTRTPYSNHFDETAPGTTTRSPLHAQRSGRDAPRANETSAAITPAATMVRIQNPAMWARRRGIVNVGSGLVEGIGIALSVGVDVGRHRKRLLVLQQDVVLEDETVHVCRHEATIGVLRR